MSLKNILALQKLKELKENGVTTVYLNDFKESIEYVETLNNIMYIGFDNVKSNDGYSVNEVYFFETIK